MRRLLTGISFLCIATTSWAATNPTLHTKTFSMSHLPQRERLDDDIHTRSFVLNESISTRSEIQTCREAWDKFNATFLSRKDVSHLIYVSMTVCHFEMQGDVDIAVSLDIDFIIQAEYVTDEPAMDAYLAKNKSRVLWGSTLTLVKLTDLTFALRMEAGITAVNDPGGPIQVADDRTNPTVVDTSFNVTLERIGEIESIMGFSEPKEFAIFMDSHFPGDIYDHYINEVMPNSNVLRAYYNIELHLENGRKIPYRFWRFPIRMCYRESNGRCG